METQHTLLSYITEKLKAGRTKSEIKEHLSAVGWQDDDIDTAFAKALIENGVPVPETGGAQGLYAKRSSAVEVVIGLFAFILLGVVATAFGVLYFNVINMLFPDSARDYSFWQIDNARNAIHYSMAALIVGFPLYVLAIRTWFRRFREEEGKVESNLTKWITYLVLLVASVVVLGDAITVLYTFLQGEISVRFFLKALTILIIAGVTFWFYYLERKKIQYRKDIPRRTFIQIGWGVFILGVLGIVLGFITAGTPGTERARTFDTQRASDLSSLSRCVTQYAKTYRRLPERLNDLKVQSNLSYCATLYDPETGSEYEYSVVAPLVATGSGTLSGSFELCGTFTLSTTNLQDVSKWGKHPAGEHCEVEEVSVSIPQSVIQQNTHTTTKNYTIEAEGFYNPM